MYLVSRSLQVLLLTATSSSWITPSFGYTKTLHIHNLSIRHPSNRPTTLPFSKSFLSRSISISTSASSSSHSMSNGSDSDITTEQPTTLMEAMSQACAKSLSRPAVQLEPTRGGGASGGGGASVSAAVDTLTGTKYFIKKASVNGGGSEMLHAEFLGVKAMSETRTIKVPTPIAFGTYGGLHVPSPMAFCVFEYLEMGGGGSQFELGVQLAKLHKHSSPNSKKWANELYSLRTSFFQGSAQSQSPIFHPPLSINAFPLLHTRKRNYSTLCAHFCRSLKI